MLTLLKDSDRPNFTKRRLTELTSKGLLPKLMHTTHAGSNTPINIWKPEVIDQVMYLYDLIEQKVARHRLFLALWLGGYEVPFEPIRQHWLQPIETLLQNLTGGEQDPDEAVNEINVSLVTYSEPRWKFSPRPDEFIHDVGVGEWTELMVVFFGMLTVPDYEPETRSYEDTLRTFQRINRIAQTNVDPKETFSWMLFLQDVFLLPRYKDVLINATTEEWVQVRHDYQTLCQLLNKLAVLFPRRNARLTPELRQRLFLHWGSILPPLLLAVRHSEYGDWIDEAFTSLNDILDEISSDPDFHSLLDKKRTL